VRGGVRTKYWLGNDVIAQLACLPLRSPPATQPKDTTETLNHERLLCERKKTPEGNTCYLHLPSPIETTINRFLTSESSRELQFRRRATIFNRTNLPEQRHTHYRRRPPSPSSDPPSTPPPPVKILLTYPEVRSLFLHYSDPLQNNILAQLVVVAFAHGWELASHPHTTIYSSPPTTIPRVLNNKDRVLAPFILVRGTIAHPFSPSYLPQKIPQNTRIHTLPSITLPPHILLRLHIIIHLYTHSCRPDSGFLEGRMAFLTCQQ
jgi:hypothetical protein